MHPQQGLTLSLGESGQSGHQLFALFACHQGLAGAGAHLVCDLIGQRLFPRDIAESRSEIPNPRLDQVLKDFAQPGLQLFAGFPREIVELQIALQQGFLNEIGPPQLRPQIRGASLPGDGQEVRSKLFENSPQRIARQSFLIRPRWQQPAATFLVEDMSHHLLASTDIIHPLTLHDARPQGIRTRILSFLPEWAICCNRIRVDPSDDLSRE